ncbi:MAG: Trk system potassium transporter TrkA [Bacteroidaceae bacterium]
MKIIIAGAGAVGTHLATLLSREHHDIVLMDENMERLEHLENNFDFMTLNLLPTSIQALREAGVAKADLFIGVTPDESRNMTCCMLASKLGAKKTVARVDNYEYTTPGHQGFFKSVGIDSIIFPEMLAAQELVNSIKRSWIRQWWEVHNGALILIGVKVREKAQILNIPLKKLCGPESPYHVVAVKRGDETIIPYGDDSLHLYDLVYFMTTHKYIPYIREIVGKEDYPDVRNVIIMGGSTTAVRAAQLMPDYMHVKIIEENEKRCEQLNELLDENKHTMVIQGDGRDISLLVDEGIRTTEAFVALADNAEKNILSCLAAKRLGVRKTVAMVENMDYVSMAESLDIGTIINKKTIAASHIYQMMLKADVSNVKCLTVANADVAEFVAKENSKITKKSIKDLGLPSNTTLGGLVRDGKGYLINGMTQVHAGDTVVVFCLGNIINKLEKYFN